MWGLVSNVLQNILFSVFFVIIARVYSEVDFGNYVIANTLYSFVMGFSSLGLGHWFVRELINTNDKQKLTQSFFKIQGMIGVAFYAVNIAISYLLYKDEMIRNISLILGINIIFDNIINAVKSLNIANQEQRKTFGLLTVEATLKCAVSCILLVWKMDIILLSFILIVLRLLTLNLFLNIGSSASLNLVKIIKSHVPWTEVKQVVLKNWPFIIIGSLSIINWRIGNILVSKWLSIKDVAIYEISYKMFSLAYLLPVVVSTTVYPMLIKAYQEGEQSLSKMYHRIFIPYVAFGFLAFSFVYAYADFFIPLLFGDRYQSVSHYVRQMFFTILIFPTIFLQANVALTLKMEKLDMICNIFSLLINVLICVIGLSYYRDLTVVNLGLFSSFFIFHIIQDVMLVRKKISSLKNVLAFYGASILLTATYIWGSSQIGNEWMFPVFWVAVGLASFLFRKKILLMFKNET